MASVDQKWEELGNEKKHRQPLHPLWTIDYNKDDKVIEWFKNALDILRERRADKDMVWRSNLEAYKGEGPFYDKVYTPRDQLKAAPPKLSQIFINHPYELTEQWVSRLMRFKSAVAILPVNNEYNDRQSAKMAKKVIDHLFVISDMDTLIEKMERGSRVFGEVYMLITYDPDIGDLQKDFAKMREKNGGKVPTEKITNEEGERGIIERGLHVGEVAFKIMMPWKLLFSPADNYSDCEYVIIESEVDVEKLKADYPDKREKISEVHTKDRLAVDNNQTCHVKVYELYHCGTQEMESGRYIKMTEELVLENDVHPYSHKKLPLVRLTDIDVPSEFFAKSFLEFIKPLSHMYNRITSFMWRNFTFGAHPKWLVQKGSTNLVNLGNAMTIVEYSGGVPPRLEAFPTIPSEMIQLREEFRNEMEKISGIHSVSRGEPPAGIKAGIALQFLEEQENQRAHSAIIKHNTMIREIAKQALSIAGDYYDEDDGRLIRILGRNDQYQIRSLDRANLSGPYDIRIQNSSALPESKAGRIQTLIELRQTFGPNVVPDDQVVDMLDLGQPERYFDYVTFAIQKAEGENEDLLDPEVKDVNEPQEFDEHIAHWQTHAKAMQTRSFVDNVTPPLRQRYIDHVVGHEYLMFEKAFGPQANPIFKQKLLTLEGWPMFFKLPNPDEPAVPMQAGGPMDGGMGMPSEQLPPDPNAPPPINEGDAMPVGEQMPVELPLPEESLQPIPVPER